MTQHEIVKGRLNYARAWLSGVLPRITDEMLPWAPTPGMRTVAGQFAEMIEVEAQLVPMLKGGEEFTEEEKVAAVGDMTSLEALKARMTEVRAQTLAYLDGLSDAELSEEISLPQWYGAYWPKSCPRAEHFRNVAEHEFYHVAQLISYMWARGDDPYSW